MPTSEFDRLQAACTLTSMKQNDLVRDAISAYIDAVSGNIDPAVVLRSARQSYAQHVNAAANSTSVQVGSSYQATIDKLSGET